MPVSFLARVVLIAALLFAQTVYAGHVQLHVNDEQTDCQICLHAATGSTALPCNQLQLLIVIPALPSDRSSTNQPPSSSFQGFRPSRDSPFRLH